MGYYVRKISRPKWPNKDYNSYSINNIRADAITGCMKTTHDELSLWKIENKEEDIKAILPIVAGFQRPSTLDIVYLPEEKFDNLGIELVQSNGRTPVKKYEGLHYDAKVNNYKGLGDFASIILGSLEENYKRINEKEVIRIIKSAVEDGTLNSKDLDEHMQKKLGYIEEK